MFPIDSDGVSADAWQVRLIRTARAYEGSINEPSNVFTLVPCTTAMTLQCLMQKRSRTLEKPKLSRNTHLCTPQNARKFDWRGRLGLPIERDTRFTLIAFYMSPRSGVLPGPLFRITAITREKNYRCATVLGMVPGTKVAHPHTERI